MIEDKFIKKKSIIFQKNHNYLTLSSFEIHVHNNVLCFSLTSHSCLTAAFFKTVNILIVLYNFHSTNMLETYFSVFDCFKLETWVKYNFYSQIFIFIYSQPMKSMCCWNNGTWICVRISKIVNSGTC